MYLAIGTGLSVFYAVVLGASATVFTTVFPLIAPILTTSGATGGMLVFTNDRLKGVLEYLIAYGVTPRRIFANVVLSSLVLATVVVAATMAGGVGVYLLLGHHLTTFLVLALTLYSVPMGYADVAFTVIIGMYWTSLSSPRTGMSSPLGLLPLVGVATPGLVLIAAVAVGSSEAVTIALGAVLLLVVIVLGLIRAVDRLMPRERFLSPA